MPPILQNPETQQTVDKLRGKLSQINYKEYYPEGLNLRPDSELHGRIVAKVLDRARVSRDVMKNKFGIWEEIDKKLNVFIHVDDAEQKVQEKDSRKPVSIVVPVSYANMETMLTFLTAADAERPLLPYMGVGPEDVPGALLLEKVVDLHVVRNKVLLPLHTLKRDALAYGFGVGVPVWTTQRGKRTRVKKESFTSPLTGEEIVIKKERVREEKVLFEGNGLETIDPRMFLPDPNYGIQDVQKGEWVGWGNITNLYSLQMEEQMPDSTLFNVRYLRHLDSITSQIVREGLESRFEDTASQNQSDVARPVHTITLYCKLFPDEWGLSNSDEPETWVFTVAADSVLIEAHKEDLDHGLYPIVVYAPEFDGYSVTPISAMELGYGSQHILDFLYNSHIANIRKMLNDMLVIDPYIMNYLDAKNPSPGKLIRVNRHSWGRGVKDGIEQLRVADVTRGHMADAAIITNLMKDTTGTTDPLRGILNASGGDRSAAEAIGARQSALERQRRRALLATVMVNLDLAYMFGKHTQQFMSEEVYIRTIGDWENILQEEYGFPDRAKVSPMDIDVDFDVVLRDPGAPKQEAADAWSLAFQTMGSNPELLQEFDIVRVFGHLARMAGATNIHEFRRKKALPQTNATVQDDDVVNRLLQSGNIVPAVGRNGGL